MAREDCVDDLWDDGVLVAHDAWKQRLFSAELGDEVLAELVFYAAGEAGRGELAGTEGTFNVVGRGSPLSKYRCLARRKGSALMGAVALHR